MSKNLLPNAIHQTLHYRPDIDGLRAVAVLAVVIFHASPLNLKGGFIGVDIFFVISGYLITSILLKNLHQDKFSVLDFYIRRANRIFPALILMLLTVFGLGWFALLPNEYAQLGKYMAAGAGFVANLALWRDLGYFDTASDLKPLLHLWSLGVEEQFYFVWPLALWLSFKRRWNLLTLTVLVSLASYYASLRGVKTDTSAAFYLPHTRFWEILVGAFVAVCHTPEIKNSNTTSKNILKRFATSFDDVLHNIFYASGTQKVPFQALRLAASVLGFGLIVMGLLKLTSASVFPGKNALWPTVGAGLLIAAGRSAWVNRVIFSNKIMVGIGLISYPLYLWHWPLLSLARIIEQETPSRAIRLGAVCLSFVLAILTFYALEKPLHRVTALGKKASVLFVLLMLTAFLGWNVYKRDGYGFRDGVKMTYMSHSYLKTDKYFTNVSLDKTTQSFEIYENKSPKNKHSLLILGDSNTQHLGFGFSNEAQLNTKLVWRGALPSLLNVDFQEINLSFTDISKTNHRFSAEVLEGYSTVLLSSLWTQYTENRGANRITYKDKRYDNWQDTTWLEPSLRETLTHLISLNKNVILAYPIPFLNFEPSNCLDNRPFAFTKQKNICLYTRDQSLVREKLVRLTFDKVLEDFPSVKTFDPSSVFCDINKNECVWKKDNEVYYTNAAHLTLQGSAVYAKAFKAKFPELFAP